LQNFVVLSVVQVYNGLQTHKFIYMQRHPVIISTWVASRLAHFHCPTLLGMDLTIQGLNLGLLVSTFGDTISHNP